MVHFRYDVLFCVVDVLEHRGLKITFRRNVEEYPFQFSTNSPAFFGILASQRPIFLPSVTVEAISSGF